MKAIVSIAAFLILISGAPSIAQQTLVIQKGIEEYDIVGPMFAYLEDSDKNLAIDQVSSMEYKSKFRNDIAGIPNFGYTRSAYWLKFTITGAEGRDEWLLVITYALLDHVSLFMPSGGSYVETKHGQLLPFGEREIRNENIVFRIRTRAGKPATYFLRVEAQDSFAVPMKLMSYQSFAESSAATRLLLGILYGFIIVTVLYNLCIFALTKDRSYLYLSLYMLAFIIFIMSENGISYQYLWPGLPWWGKRAIPFSVSMVAIWSSLFAKLFLQTKSLSPRIDKTILGFCGLGSFGLVLALAAPYFFAIIYAVLLCVLYAPALIVAGILQWRRGYRPAVFFLISWFGLIVGVLLYGFKTLGLLPESMLTKYGVLIGAAFQSVLLSIAMAERINMTDTLRIMKDKLEKRTASLLGIFEKAEIMSGELFSVSTEHSEIVDTFSRVAQNQAAHAEEMAASYEQLTSTTESIDLSMGTLAGESEKIREMAGILNTLQQEVRHTNEAMLDSMKNIIHFTEKTDADLTRMAEMMQIINEGGRSITSVISLINDISDKINLLSLNASIEAARAGEHGRGFAVVADEIGKLATATTDNSKQISSQIDRISVDIRKGIEIANITRQSTSDVAKHVAGINSQIATVKSAIARQESAIGEMVGQSDIIREQSRIISVATGEQKHGMLEGSATIQNLANMANDIALSNNKILEFIQILNQKAAELKDIVQILDEKTG